MTNRTLSERRSLSTSHGICRNRHCPKCQGPARARWLANRQAELLPVPYFHVVFTLPAAIGAIAYQNKAVVYTILFKAAAEAITRLAANPRRLGAEIGVVAVLHTWGQALTHHPHVHCIVPGGGLSPGGTRWIASRPNFFLAVKPLSRLFRRLFLERLKAAFEASDLAFFSDLKPLADPTTFATHLAAVRRIEWVVYSKRLRRTNPGSRLSRRYTHRVAIANSRLVAAGDDHVAFTWKDYRQNGATKIMKLKPSEFIRRFLLHTLPDGFHRIRHFGFMANGHRTAKLALCCSLLIDSDGRSAPKSAAPSPDHPSSKAAADLPTCPGCGGVMRIISRIAHGCGQPFTRAPPFRCDTS